MDKFIVVSSSDGWDIVDTDDGSVVNSYVFEDCAHDYCNVLNQLHIADNSVNDEFDLLVFND